MASRGGSAASPAVATSPSIPRAAEWSSAPATNSCSPMAISISPPRSSTAQAEPAASCSAPRTTIGLTASAAGAISTRSPEASRTRMPRRPEGSTLGPPMARRRHPPSVRARSRSPEIRGMPISPAAAGSAQTTLKFGTWTSPTRARARASTWARARCRWASAPARRVTSA